MPLSDDLRLVFIHTFEAVPEVSQLSIIVLSIVNVGFCLWVNVRVGIGAQPVECGQIASPEV